jgi:hypothetical protein
MKRKSFICHSVDNRNYKEKPSKTQKIKYEI